jgi:hypothetical protein
MIVTLKSRRLHMAKTGFPIGGLIAAALMVFFLPSESVGQSNGDVVVTVRNELGTTLTGATFSFRTQGMAGTETVVDGGAGDNDGTANGEIWG